MTLSMFLSKFFSKISKKLERSDDRFVSEFLADKEHSNRARRRVRLESLCFQRAGLLFWIFVSISTVVFGVSINIFWPGNPELSFFANVQHNIQQQILFTKLPLFLYSYLFLSILLGIFFKNTDSQIKMLLLYEKTQTE